MREIPTTKAYEVRLQSDRRFDTAMMLFTFAPGVQGEIQLPFKKLPDLIYNALSAIEARSQQLGSMENGPDGTLVEGCQLIPTNVVWSLDKTDKGKGPVSLVFRFSPDVSLGFLVDRATLARLAADASEAE